MGMVGEMFMGSVSADLIRQCHEVPIWLLDGEITSSSCLLAVHGTPESLRAADHLAFVLQDSPHTHIFLYHSSSTFGSNSTVQAADFYTQWGKEWCDQHLDLDNNLYNAHASILTDQGIKPENITHLPPHMGLSTGYDLMREAKKNNCGTLVIGRRGRDVEKGIFRWSFRQHHPKCPKHGYMAGRIIF